MSIQNLGSIAQVGFESIQNTLGKKKKKSPFSLAAKIIIKLCFTEDEDARIISVKENPGMCFILP